MRGTTAALVLWVIAVVCFACACGASRPAGPAQVEVTPHTLYPLALGNAWSYDVNTGDDSVLAVSRVVAEEGSTVQVQSGEATLRYEKRPDGVYRPAREGYLLQEPIRLGAEWDSGSGTRARVAAVDLALETPAGRFERCVRVQETATTGANIETTYCPGVGPVIVSSEMTLSRGTATVVARLRGYQVPKPR